MICHLIPDEKFTEKVITFFNNNYDEEKHFFIVYNEGKKFLNLKADNLMLIDDIRDGDNRVNSYLKNCDKIFIHGFGAKQIIYYFNRHISLMKKSVVIIWGGDLYNDHLFLEDNKGICLRLRFNIWLKRRIISRAPYFMTFTYTDYDRAKEWLNANGVRFDCLYPSNLDIDSLHKINSLKKAHPSVRIMIGISATETNNHFEAFAAIAHLANEDIEVVCPLSYGDMNYAREVEIEGRRLFGDKFVSINNYMSIEEYSSLLADIDVAVFAFDRQQATGNLEILSYFGAKIYIKKTCALWDHYVTRDGCVFHDFEKLKNSSLDEINDFSEKEKKINRDYFSKIWDEKYICSLWDRVLQYEKSDSGDRKT